MQTLVKKIDEFNNTHSEKSYNEILSKIYPNAIRCKDCGNHIIYSDTKIGGYKRKSKKTGKFEIYISGKSFLTRKTHGETLKICESCLRKKFPDYDIMNKSRIFNTINELTVYAFNIKDRSKYFTGPTKERCIKKHGKEKGLKVWTNYCKRQSETNTFKYKSKKYGISKEEFNKFNKSRAVTLKNLVKKYGDDLGRKKWNEYLEKQRETKSLEYMIKKFGKNKTELINKSKGITLKNFTKKYGEEEGTKRFIKIINKQQSFYSKISQEFFNKLDKILREKYTTYYATKNTEFGVNLSIGYVKLDYYIKELNLCIEFNGDLFHANPKVYKKDDCPNPFNKNLSAKEIWKNDKIRYNTLKKEKNINTIIVWQSEYETLNINEFINKNIKQNGILF
jgi:hypothetical protein